MTYCEVIPGNSIQYCSMPLIVDGIERKVSSRFIHFFYLYVSKPYAITPTLVCSTFGGVHSHCPFGICISICFQNFFFTFSVQNYSTELPKTLLDDTMGFAMKVQDDGGQVIAVDFDILLHCSFSFTHMSPKSHKGVKIFLDGV